MHCRKNPYFWGAFHKAHFRGLWGFCGSCSGAAIDAGPRALMLVQKSGRFLQGAEHLNLLDEAQRSGLAVHQESYLRSPTDPVDSRELRLVVFE
jgi:hypothetical protein